MHYLGALMYCCIPLGPQTFKDYISFIKANEGKNVSFADRMWLGQKSTYKKGILNMLCTLETVILVSMFCNCFINFHICCIINYWHFTLPVLFTVPCFCEKNDKKKSHWHCFKCDKIIQRGNAFEQHLQKHGKSLGCYYMIINHAITELITN